MADTNENVIEFLRNQQTATATFCSATKLNNKIRKLVKEYLEEVQIIAENPDGSIVAHFPTKWVKISPPRKMTDEQREQAAERLAQYRK